MCVTEVFCICYMNAAKYGLNFKKLNTEIGYVVVVLELTEN